MVDKLPLTAKDGIHFGFNFNLPGAQTRIDIPWGVMRPELDQWPAANRNWLVMQRWADISDETDGVTWCSLDAMLAETGSMTANQTGTWNGERKPWLKKSEQAPAIWSWVMNNHWFTNFPLTQDGPVTFRYRLLPHGAFDVATANRFGLEQAQPLVALAADKNAIASPLVALDGPPAVIVSSMKSTGDGKSVIIRLRSVSGRNEPVKLNWLAGTPKSVSLCEREEVPSAKAGAEIVVPAMGMVVIRADFQSFE